MNDTTEGSSGSRVVCRAAQDLVVRPAILAAALVAFGIWCALDQKDYQPFATDMNAWLTWAMNFYGQFVFSALGLIPLYFAIRAHRRRLVADEAGIGYQGKQSIPWSDVTGLDAGELEAKQILHVLHGRGERFTLDGFNLQNFAELVTFVENHAPQTGQAEPPVEPEPARPPVEAEPEQAPDRQEPADP